MKKIKIRLVLIAMLAMMVLAATYALPLANAETLTQEPGPVGYRELPYGQGPAYCDNFYDGPPSATTPSGQPWQGVTLQQVYWCYSENKGYWIPTSPSI